MDAKVGDAEAQNIGYEPTTDLIQEQDCDTLLIYLHGFMKEQLKVQLARSGILRVRGTRPLGDNKVISFQKDYPVSPSCDTNNITARFEGGILYVRQPKLIVPAEREDEKSPVLVTQPAQRPVAQRPPTPIPSRLKKDQENDNTKKTSSTEAKIKEESAAGFRDKSDMEPAMEGKVSESGKNKKAGTVYDDQRAEPSITDRREEFSVAKVGEDEVDYYKLVAAGTAAKLRKSEKIKYMVMAVILAFAFGMYVNNLIWCPNKPEK